MNQIPSHSNTQSFGRKSPTSQILYQEPTQAEMRPVVKPFKSICAVLVMVIFTAFVILTMLRSCADEQYQNGEKYRAMNAAAQK